jgi:hypothetical protein
MIKRKAKKTVRTAKRRGAKKAKPKAKAAPRGYNIHAGKPTGRQNETSPPKILTSGSGRCRSADNLAHREGAKLSVPAGALDRRFSAWWRGRRVCPPDGTQWLSDRLGQQFVIDNRPPQRPEHRGAR